MEGKTIQKDQLEKIRHFLELEYYDSAVKECSTLFEVILKKIYGRALVDFSIEDRAILMECEAKIGNKTKGYNRFGFGELVGLFNKSRLLEKWERNTEQNLGIIRSISLEYIVELRNQLTHQPASENKSSKNEAQLVFNCLTNWLSFIGYSELNSGITKAMTHNKVNEEKKEDFTEEYLKSKTESNYNSGTLSESKRLAIQMEYSEQSDEEAFVHALKNIGQKADLIGLDIGCADGSLTGRRFKDQYGFTKVIGIDMNDTLIKKANNESNGNYYYCLNVEEEDFEDKLEEIKIEHKIEAFDIIYLSYTLHHLKEPLRFLRKIRRHLTSKGAIIITGVDDGAQIAYDDQNLVQEITNLSIKTSNISDRFGARKFYTYLKNSGFNTVMLFYGMNDTSTMTPEDKELLFQYYFSFRKDYTLKQLKSNPQNQEYIDHHNKMIDRLKCLEDVFNKPDFYYLVLVFTAVGFR